MRRNVGKWFLAAALLFGGFGLAAAAIVCSVCHKEIHGQYLKADGKTFCSEQCYATVVPKCAKCGKPCIKGYYTFGQKKFCSESCRATEMCCSVCGATKGKFMVAIGAAGEQMLICESCSKAPRCFSCGLPRRGRTLPDGRLLCKECDRDLVKTENDLISQFRRVRADLKRYYGYDYDHYIKFQVVSPQTMEKLSQGIYLPPGGMRLALMNCRYVVTERTSKGGEKSYSMHKMECSIYVLNNVPRDMMIDALAHELTHDYLRHQAGRIDDLKMEEGFCEAMAADYNLRRGKKELNLRKENNPDPIYGEGYRQMRGYMAKNGFAGTVNLLKSKSVDLIESVKRGR